jgi:quercetin dioxygenase-like cupin family protein
MKIIPIAKEDLPKEWIFEADGISIKQMALKKGWIVPQHAHVYDHYTMLAHGRMQVWVEDILLNEYKAPSAIFIEKGKKHRMVAMEDDTVAYCIHNMHGLKDVQISAIHELES